MIKKKTKLKISMCITLFVGITFAFFMWISWQKLTILLGNSNLVWVISGGVVLVAIIFGYFGIDRIVKRFT